MRRALSRLAIAATAAIAAGAIATAAITSCAPPPERTRETPPSPAAGAPAAPELPSDPQGLAAALGGEDLGTVVAAADAIQALGPAGAPAAGALASLLDHPQPWIRIAAQDALAAIGKPAVPALLEVLRSGPGFSPARAAIVLGQIGPEAADALPDLRKGVEGGPPNLRGILTAAIAAIEGRPAVAPGGTAADTEPATPAVAIAADATSGAASGSTDWPGFRGPRRDGISRDRGLLEEWPEGGPPHLWTLQGLGRGYSSVSIAGGRVFTMGDRKGADGTETQQVLAFDLGTRHELWSFAIGPPHDDGPRCTPSVDGDLVFALGTAGELACLETATGSVRWRRSLPSDFGGKVMSIWKYAESPLVDGDRVVCSPGGPDAMLAALDRETGETLWKCAVPPLGDRGLDGASYASAVVAEIAGVRQYVQLVGRGAVGVAATDGRFLWGYNGIANSTANIPTPVVRGDHVFVTTSYDTGCALLRIEREGEASRAVEVYRAAPEDFENHHGGVVLVGDHIYGGHGQNRGRPTCLELATGKVAWQDKPLDRGSASIVYADGHLILRYDRGLVALVEATPEAFRPKGSFRPPAGDGPAWAYPVVHEGRLYLRHGDILTCHDLRAP